MFYPPEVLQTEVLQTEVLQTEVSQRCGQKIDQEICKGLALK
jgi:hypothetical protein